MFPSTSLVTKVVRNNQNQSWFLRERTIIILIMMIFSLIIQFVTSFTNDVRMFPNNDVIAFTTKIQNNDVTANKKNLSNKFAASVPTTTTLTQQQYKMKLFYNFYKTPVLLFSSQYELPLPDEDDDYSSRSSKGCRARRYT